MLYSLALFFEESVVKQILEYSKKVSKSFGKPYYPRDGEWIPHITLLRWESKKELPSKQVKKIIRLSRKPLNVTFSGLTLLPSNNKAWGVWVEISVLKSKELLELQQKLLQQLRGVKIVSNVGDRFRPHVTLNRIKNEKNRCIAELDIKLLRRKEVRVFPKLGMGKKEFAWLDK